MWAVGLQGTVVRTTDGGNTWVEVSPPASTVYVYHGLFFRDALRGWVVGSAGRILTTADGGASWALLPSRWYEQPPQRDELTRPFRHARPTPLTRV